MKWKYKGAYNGNARLKYKFSNCIDLVVQSSTLKMLHVNYFTLMCMMNNFCVLVRCEHIPVAGESCRSGADSRGEGMAAQEPGPCPNSLVKTDQQRR